jgi:dTDP-4-amino-4,6-dideoxygalactose transaminase
MSEINAAFGLLQLRHIDAIMNRRAAIDTIYRRALAGVPGIRCIGPAGQKVSNHSYFPILVEPDYPLSRDALYEKLKIHGIHGRRYFYPLISDFPMYRALPSAQRSNLPVAATAADRVLCLPIYPALRAEDQQRVIDVLCQA